MSVLLFVLLIACTWRNQAEALVRWQQRLAAGRAPRLADIVSVSLWWATAVNVLICGGLVATRKFWWTNAARHRSLPPRGLVVGGRWFWTALLAAVVVGAALRLPRMGLSLYSDEEYALRTYLMGRWEEGEAGRPVFRPVGWDATLWANREGNNHVFHSLASRCSLDLWRSLSGAPPGSFSESALRLPAFLAGCLGIAALGLALRALGLPHAGALAAALAAVHPWHIRYSTEARGYALVLLLAPLLVTLAAGTLRDGRWRWWFGFAFAEAALLASFPGALPLAAALSLALGAAILLDAFPLLDAGPAFARFVVSHVVAAMGFLWLMAPSLPQIHAFLHADRMRSGPGWETARSIWSHLALGMNWASGPVENPLILSVPGPGWVAGPLAVALVVAVIPALILLGLRRLARLGSGPFLVGIALAAALPMACAHLWLNRSTVLVWYLIFALPGLLLLVAAGLSPGRSDDFERVRLSRHGGTWGAWRHVPGIVFLTLFVASTHRQAAILMHHPKEDLRGTARWVRGEPAEGAIGVIFWSNAPVYDPGLRVVWNAAELWRWMERASAEGRPLRVGYGHRPMSNQNDATRALLALAEDPRYFDPVAVLPGLDEDQFTHRVNAFKAAGLAPPEHDRVE